MKKLFCGPDCVFLQCGLQTSEGKTRPTESFYCVAYGECLAGHSKELVYRHNDCEHVTEQEFRIALAKRSPESFGCCISADSAYAAVLAHHFHGVQKEITLLHADNLKLFRPEYVKIEAMFER